MVRIAVTAAAFEAIAAMPQLGDNRTNRRKPIVHPGVRLGG